MSEGWAIFLISEAIVIFGGLLAIYVKVKVSIAELEIRMKVSEARLKDVEDTDHEMNRKLDKILDKVTTVQIELQNKANR